MHKAFVIYDKQENVGRRRVNRSLERATCLQFAVREFQQWRNSCRWQELFHKSKRRTLRWRYFPNIYFRFEAIGFHECLVERFERFAAESITIYLGGLSRSFAQHGEETLATIKLMNELTKFIGIPALRGLNCTARNGITRFVGCVAIVDARLRGVNIFRGRGSGKGGLVIRAELLPNEKAHYAGRRNARDSYNLPEISRSDS